MQIELIQERAFTVRAGTKAVHGLFHVSEWEGLNKYQDNAGRTLILNDSKIVKGSPELLSALADTHPGFVQVPETKLPSGFVVPAFKVAQHAATNSENDDGSTDLALKPWTNISFHAAEEACKSMGYNMITETQWLAIAYNLSQQDCNWTGGKVGEGDLFQGIRNGGGDKPSDYVPSNISERRWMMLSNGEKVCDFNGNVFQWVFDDVQGDEKGLIAKSFASESLSMSTPPFVSRKNGMGWRPDVGTDWSGNALVRGGYWYSNDHAGVFYLNRCHPGGENDNVGFRCTLP